jgi:hypothetical protein
MRRGQGGGWVSRLGMGSLERWMIDGQLFIGSEGMFSLFIVEVSRGCWVPRTTWAGLYFDNHTRSVCFFAIELLIYE